MKKLFFCALCVLLTALGLTSCASESSPSSASFQAMDTLMSLKVYGSADTCEQLQNKITELDSSLDATDEKSEIFRLNTEKSAVVSKDTAALLSDSLALCDRLDGCFDLTVYPAVQAWGFTTGDYRVPTDSELKALSDKIDYTAVTLSDDGRVSLPENVMLDLGAVAKGYAADVSRTILAANKAQAAVLNLGGTICLYGKKPDGSRFTVGIADPETPRATSATFPAMILPSPPPAATNVILSTAASAISISSTLPPPRLSTTGSSPSPSSATAAPLPTPPPPPCS